MAPNLDLSLYLVTQAEQVLDSATLEGTVKSALEGGATIVQLREKDLPTRDFIKRAQSLLAICKAHEVPLLVNDRLDVALAIGADGIHIGQDDMPLATARKLLPPGSIIGVSASTIEEALEAARGGADYLGVGACWATGSKAVADDKILGPRGVRKILDALLNAEFTTPVVAIGGINESNLSRTLYGCVSSVGFEAPQRLAGVAVVSALMKAPNPAAVSRAMSTVTRTFRSSPLIAEPVSSESLVTRITELLRILHPPFSKGGVVHHITNDVVKNDCANFTLALRSSPIMSGEAGEAEDLSALPGALVLNLGTLSASQVEAMREAGRWANRRGKAIVCDPVGVGASQLRKTMAFRLLNDVQMTVIKGNGGEIATLLGQAGARSRGVDSCGSLEDPARIVRDLARAERCVVVMTGAIDFVSDGISTYKLENGVEMLASITGSGCMTGSSIGCFLAAAAELAEEEGRVVSGAGLMTKGDVLAAAIGGVTLLNVAGEMASESEAVKGPNTFRSALIDAVYNASPVMLSQRARISKIDV